ncbi:hypothetical protein D3C84_911410 [compost metagenome]
MANDFDTIEFNAVDLPGLERRDLGLSGNAQIKRVLQGGNHIGAELRHQRFALRRFPFQRDCSCFFINDPLIVLPFI